MYETLIEIMTGGVFAFLLVFVRIGTAVMIMPGIGDSYVSGNIRISFALALSFCVFPVLQPLVPSPIPPITALFVLLIMEFIIGLFIGTVARTMMMALDTAGMVISSQSGLANAQVFNPSLATQGSLIGAFLSVSGVVLLFVTDMHHLVLLGIFESYQLFPLGDVPEAGSMAELIARIVAHSFMVGVKIGTPFIVITLMIYVCMGVLARLMPQVQVFLLALPMQILLSFITLMLVLSTAMMFWLQEYQSTIVYFLSQ